MVRLDSLTLADLPLIVEWRKANPEGARTPTLVTVEQERKWFDSLQERGSPHRYWAVRAEHLGGIVKIHYQAPSEYEEIQYPGLVGLAGLTYIDPDNRRAEIAILIDPSLRGKGLGKQALMLVLAKGFDDMDLEQIYGEVYHCNQYLAWWQKLIEKYGWESRILPKVKRWGGQRWDATWFVVTAQNWEKMKHDNRGVL